MRITLKQTGVQEDIGKHRCCVCYRGFHLGPAMCQAIDESNVLYGEVCPSCIERGPEHIRAELQYHAWWARMIAEQKTTAASEEVTDCPTLEELLTAETFYERAMYETGDEYDAAFERGEIE